LKQSDLDWFAARLSIAVYDTNRITPEMSVFELKQALVDIPGIETMAVGYAPNGNQLVTIDDKTVEVGPMASNDEIRFALLNPFIRTENTKMSVTGYKPGAIRAALDAAKRQAQEELTAAMGTLSEAQTKAAEVPAAIKQVAGQIKREAEDALQEFAEFTNGGPPLDDVK
jgi:hypothetical protein